MKKLYFLIPLIATLAFYGYYRSFNAGFEAREAAKVEAIRLEKEEAMKKEAEDRKGAIEEALRLQEERKVEKAAKEAKDEAKKAARTASLDAREAAYREQQRLQKQVERFEGDIAVVQADMEKIEKTKEVATGEIAFLKEYVSAAQSNVKSLTTVLQRIQAADAAQAAAAAAAAANKKS